MSKVSVVKVGDDDVRAAVYRSLDLLRVPVDRPIDTVVIKPNLCHYFTPDTGITTDPRVVGSVIDYIRERINGDADIVVGEADATGMRADVAFQVLKYEELAAAKRVRLLNLSKDTLLSVDGQYVTQVPETLRTCDLLVTVPKLKTHTTMTMSVSLKNQFGALPHWRKIAYHKHLVRYIVEAARFMTPHLCVVDGLVALEGKGPTWQGRPIRMDLIISGDDPVATDHVCAQIMGFPHVKHVSQAEQAGIGSTRDIAVLGERIRDVKRDFRLVTPTEYLAIVGQDAFRATLRFYRSLRRRRG
jgi:uncharacterized protein (DUF362 family)